MVHTTPEVLPTYPRVTEVDVVVVGAGVSGLNAASQIAKTYKYKTLVLEARPLIGGRVKQDHTFLPGREVECGAEFIHGDINMPTELCEDFNWGRRQIFTWSHGDGGPSKKRAPDGGCGYYYLSKQQKLIRFDAEDEGFRHCNRLLQTLGDVDAAAADADTRSLRQYLADNGVVEPYLSLADAGYCNTQGGTLDTVPAARACRFERAWEGDGTVFDPDFRMDPSYRVLIDYLSAGLDVRVSCPVLSISVDTEAVAASNAELEAAAAKLGEDCAHDELRKPGLPAQHAVTVTCKDGSIVRAHRVVVTVPLPIMRAEEIAFSPPLAPHKVAAAQSLAFANGVKILLKFNRRPWPADCHGAVCSDAFVPECWMNGTNPPGALIVGKADYRSWYDEALSDDEEEDAAPAHSAKRESLSLADSAAPGASPLAPVPDQQDGVQYIVTGFTMGDRADALAALPQPVVLARFLAQLDAMFGMDASGAFMEGFVHSWADEPYIRGAYSAVTSDAHTGAARAMAEPHCGAVFFAGEATAGAIEAHKRAESVHFASPIVLHGAMATGSTAACDVARSLGVPVVCLAADHGSPEAGCAEDMAGLSISSAVLSGVEADAVASPVSRAGSSETASSSGSSVASGSSIRAPRGKSICGHLKRLVIKADAATEAVAATSRGSEHGYATPIIPVSRWSEFAATSPQNSKA